MRRAGSVDLQGVDLAQEAVAGEGARHGGAAEALVLAEGDFDVPAAQGEVDDAVGLPGGPAQVGQQPPTRSRAGKPRSSRMTRRPMACSRSSTRLAAARPLPS